jgi:hypothetical protein
MARLAMLLTKVFVPIDGLLTRKDVILIKLTRPYLTQAVSRRFPTAAARVLSQLTSCGICGAESGTRTRFLRVHRFPLPILIPPTAPY